MKTYVLGAGASLHVGYPLAGDMGAELVNWMQRQDNPNYQTSADWVLRNFGLVINIEDLFSTLQQLIADLPRGASERGNVANFQMPTLIQALREWFAEIRSLEAPMYRQFARNIVAAGDCIITFNYDVSLDRQLHHAGNWEAGDGYGFVSMAFRLIHPRRF